MKARAITLFTVLMAITACTEKVPIVPDYSGGNDWAPTIELTGQGYGRVSLSWEDTPAPSAVHRNIEQMVLEATENNLSVVFVDTILSVRGIPLGYESPAVFDAPRFYGVRVRVDYRGGVQRYSNVVQFYTRVVPGQVLKTFSLTPPPPFGNYFPSGIAFDNGRIYTMVGKTLIAIDTLDGR